MPTRRAFRTSALALVLAAPAARALGPGIRDRLDDAMAVLEARSGGRLGVAIRAGGAGLTCDWRGEERVRMASTFKALLAGAVLWRVDRSEESLGRAVEVRAEDLVPHAPAVEPAVGGTLSVGALCEAAVTLSDNAAANLLLRPMGGPAGFTDILRGWGDATTRLDRYEPDLNESAPNDPRDMTTPLAFLATMERLLLGGAVSSASRDRLLAWLVANRTGATRIRAGVPAGWAVGDKTGTSRQGDVHDVAILLPPGRPPVLVAAFLSGTSRPKAELDLIHAQIGALAVGLA